MKFVPDASSVVAALFPDEREDEEPPVLGLLRSSNAVAPSIWPAEVANALLVGVRSRRLAYEQAASSLMALDEFRVELMNWSALEIARDILPLAQKHGLTVYDTLYLSAAQSCGGVLVSRDKALLRAARLEGIEVT